MTRLPSARQLLAEMEPVVGDLLDRHHRTAREWFPHELVPWSQGRDFAVGERWSEQEHPLPPGVRSAILVNLLTEENLPYYYATLRELGLRDGAWADWARRWTAEEARHATVIRDYALVTRILDPRALERERMHVMSIGFDIPQWSLLEGLVYTMLQELAARVAHRNTGHLLPEPHGQILMRHVAADENLHYVFYRDLLRALFEAYPSATMCALDSQTRRFAMPGTSIRGFRSHAFAVANAGIYDLRIHYETILAPLLRRWRVDQLAGLNDRAELARERLVAHVDRVGRVAKRQREAIASQAGE